MAIANVRLNKSYLDIKESITIYRGAFRLVYGAKFMHARFENILDIMMLSKYLSTRLRASYLQYVRRGGFLPGNGEGLFTLERLRITKEGCL